MYKATWPTMSSTAISWYLSPSKSAIERRSRARVTGRLELGAGYTWRGDVTVRPDVNTDSDPIETDSASLGDVSPRGFA